MRTLKFIAASLMAFGCVALSICGSANGQWPGDHSARSGYYMELNGKAYQRPGDDLGIGLVFDSVTLQTLMNTGDVTGIGGGSGAEVKFGNSGRGRDWEIRTNIGTWSNSMTVDSPSGNQVTSPLITGIDPDQVGFDYDSDLFSIELNMRRCVRPGVTLFAGPRFVSLVEDFDFRTQTEVATPFGPFDLTSSNQFRARNSLIGGQIGAEILMPLNRALYAEAFIRAGGFYNPTEVRTLATTSITTPVETRRSKSTGSFVGEVGGKLHYQLIPNTCTTFVGYEATWIDGVALAPVQAITVGNTGVITSNTPFFHAVLFGINFEY